jgi:hypothetical protein
MRPMTTAMILVTFALPLVAFANTNIWEVQGDSLIRSNPGLAVELYAKSLMTDGAYVMAIQDSKTQEPYLVAMERVLDKIPWNVVVISAFQELMLGLKPVIETEFQDGDRRERIRELVSKYRLVAGEDDTTFDNFVSDEIPVTKIDIVKIPITKFDIVKIPITKFDTVQVQLTKLVITEVSSTSVYIVFPGEKDIPENVIAVMRIPIENVTKARSAYDFAFKVMGQDGLYIPSDNSSLGIKYKALTDKIDAAGSGWTTDNKLVAEWEDYWKHVKRALDSRSKVRRKQSNIQ